MRVSLGLGLTNNCNLACAHCYRPEPPVTDLPAATVRAVCDALPVHGVNLGTGENVLHPEFFQILEDLLGRDLRVSLTSNGLSVAKLPDDVLRRLHDVEVSIDFPDRASFDAFRGPGAWETALSALRRCADLGVPTTVLSVLMRENHRGMAQLAKVVAEEGAPLRVNLYQPVHTDAFAPTYDELWHAVADLLEHTTLLACSEPVICAAAGLDFNGLKCGSTSLRITPSGDLLPCVYWPEAVGHADQVPALGERVFAKESFRALHQTPSECHDCDWFDHCRGGCASRRMRVHGTLDRRDPYCPKIGGVDLRGRVRVAHAGDRLHTGNVCTLLVRG